MLTYVFKAKVVKSCAKYLMYIPKVC